MNMIIGGSEFNTDLATVVCERSATNRRGTLYRKKNGSYFFCNDNGIEPLLPEEAKEWARAWMAEDTFQAEFGGVEANQGTLTIAVSADTKRILDRIGTYEFMLQNAASDYLLADTLS